MLIWYGQLTAAWDGIPHPDAALTHRHAPLHNLSNIQTSGGDVASARALQLAHELSLDCGYFGTTFDGTARSADQRPRK